MPVLGFNWIAGSPSAESSDVFTSINPRNKSRGEVAFHNATEFEVDQAARKAFEAYQVTRRFSPERLAAFLETAAEEIEHLGDELIETADMETALGSTRLSGERVRTTNQLLAFAALIREGSYVEAIIDTALPDRKPAPRPDIRRMLFPLGPVAVFSASNFPFAFAVAGGDSASAWAAGCPVVVKGHPGHPATSELFAQAINRAIERTGCPPGFFSLLQGDKHTVGQTLVRHPFIEAVGFTGSLRGGRALFDTANQRPKPIPVYAEMGSVNPVIILQGALAARAQRLAEGLVSSATLGAGQFCTNPGLVFVTASPEAERFIAMVVDAMSNKEAGILLNAQVEEGLQRAVRATTQKESVTLLTGGNVQLSEGYCFQNTVLRTSGSAFLHDPDLQSEHFGAVTLFVVCNSYEELRSAVDSLQGNLTATIHAEVDESERAQELFDLLREKAGRLILNGFPTGVEVVHAQQHGGPYPATTSPTMTSVGMTAIKRFMRPVAFQNMPDTLLPDALKNGNPLRILRLVDGMYTREPIG